MELAALDWSNIAAPVIVAVTAMLFLVRALRRKGGAGSCGSCGTCGPKDKLPK